MYIIIIIIINITYVKKTLNKNEEGEEGSKLKAVKVAEAIIKKEEEGDSKLKGVKVAEAFFYCPVACTAIFGGGGH